MEVAGCPLQPGDPHACPVPLQRALLEQKQKKKRQEPLMVQANADGRPRSRRARQSEEQAPLVESYLSSSGSTSYQGTPCPRASLGQPAREAPHPLGTPANLSRHGPSVSCVQAARGSQREQTAEWGWWREAGTWNRGLLGQVLEPEAKTLLIWEFKCPGF